MTRIRILLTGKTGQVGYELERSLQGLGEIIAPTRTAKNAAHPVGAHPGAKAVARLLPSVASESTPTKGNLPSTFCEVK